MARGLKTSEFNDDAIWPSIVHIECLQEINIMALSYLPGRAAIVHNCFLFELSTSKKDQKNILCNCYLHNFYNYISLAQALLYSVIMFNNLLVLKVLL